MSQPMSTTEILEELPRLSLVELQMVHERIIELESGCELDPSNALRIAIEQGLHSEQTESTEKIEAVRERLIRWAGSSI